MGDSENQCAESVRQLYDVTRTSDILLHLASKFRHGFFSILWRVLAMASTSSGPQHQRLRAALFAFRGHVVDRSRSNFKFASGNEWFR